MATIRESLKMLPALKTNNGYTFYYRILIHCSMCALPCTAEILDYHSKAHNRLWRFLPGDAGFRSRKKKLVEKT